MAELKIDLIVDNKGSIQIQKFGMDAEKAMAGSAYSTQKLNKELVTLVSLSQKAQNSLNMQAEGLLQSHAKDLTALASPNSAISGVTAKFKTELEELRQHLKLTDTEFTRMVQRFETVQGGLSRESAFSNLSKSLQLSRVEIDHLGRQFGMTEAQIDKVAKSLHGAEIRLETFAEKVAKLPKINVLGSLSNTSQAGLFGNFSGQYSSLAQDITALSQSEKMAGLASSAFANDLKELGKHAKLTDDQMRELQIRLTKAATSEAQENALKRLGSQLRFTDDELKALGRQFGMTEAQMSRVVVPAKSAGNAIEGIAKSVNESNKAVKSSSSSFSSFGKIAKSSLAIFSTYEILQFVKSIGETVVQLDSLQRSFAGITGSQQQAVVEMEYLRQVSDKTGQSFYNLAGGYQQLTASTKGTNLEGKKTRDVFLAVSEAAAVLGLSQDRVDLSIRALGQMASKGQVQMEELKNQLGDHIPGAVQIAARALGVTTKELYDMSKLGDLLAEDVIPAIAAEWHKMYGKAAQTAALESGQAAVNKLSESWKDFKANIANSQMVIDIIWGIANALKEVNRFSKAEVGIEVGMPIVGSVPDYSEKELHLMRVAYLERGIANAESERARIQGNAGRQGASDQQAKAIKELTERIAANKKELTSLNKVVNNQSPFVTGEAAGKVNVAADAFGHLGFKMQGVREMSKSEREEYVKSHNEMLKYVETDEQAAKKRFDAAYAGARSEKERAEVIKKYEEELEEIKKRRGKAGESAAKKAANEAEKEAAAYQATIERLLPLERAQREYNEDLATLDKMDPSHSTERYKTALANLNQELQDAVENSQKYAKAQEDAKMSAFESELNQKSTAIEISIAQGNLTDKSALPFQIDILQQKLKAYQERLANMPKKTSEDISAWNSQAEAIQQTTLELARYQQQMRLLDTNESFKQGMIDWRESGPQEMADFYRTALPNAMDSSADATAKFFRDIAQGNINAGDAWRALGQTVSDVVFDILQEMIKLEIKMAMINSMGNSGGIGGFFSSLFGFGSSSSSVASSGTAFSDVSQVASWMPFANGGIMTSAGPIPLRSYANGGIATSPQFSYFGEGRMNEAYVPLPDGRSIPVTVSGGGGSGDDETKGLLRDLITAVQSGGSVRIINAFGDDEVANSLSGSSGERMVLNHVKRNISMINSMRG